MSSIITTIIIFVFIAALLLWFVIGIKGKPIIKTILILIILPLSVTVWNSIESYQGWATPKPIPNKSLFLSGVIFPPDKQRGYEGEIFLWLLEYKDPIELEKEKNKKSFTFFLAYKPKNEPRAHKVPYSKELEKQVEEALENNKKGIMTIVEKNKGKGKKPDGQDATGNNAINGNEDVGKWTNYETDYRFYPLPPPKFPEKMRENQ